MAPLLFKDEHQFHLNVSDITISVHRLPADGIPNTLFGNAEAIRSVYRDKTRKTVGSWTKDYSLPAPKFHLLAHVMNDASSGGVPILLSFNIDLQNIADEFC